MARHTSPSSSRSLSRCRSPPELETAEYEVLISPSAGETTQSKPASTDVQVEVGAVSHTGRVRSRNEDHFLVSRVSRQQEILQTNMPPDSLPDLHRRGRVSLHRGRRHGRDGRRRGRQPAGDQHQLEALPALGAVGLPGQSEGGPRAVRAASARTFARSTGPSPRRAPPIAACWGWAPR